jgi:hypothetical protein
MIKTTQNQSQQTPFRAVIIPVTGSPREGFLLAKGGPPCAVYCSRPSRMTSMMKKFKGVRNSRHRGCYNQTQREQKQRRAERVRDGLFEYHLERREGICAGR